MPSVGQERKLKGATAHDFDHDYCVLPDAAVGSRKGLTHMNEPSGSRPLATPNYGFFEEHITGVVEQVPGFLRSLDFRSLIMVLSLFVLMATAVALAWPYADSSGYRVLGAFGVAVVIAVVGFVSFLQRQC